MIAVKKFNLTRAKVQSIAMPHGAKFLRLNACGMTIQAWALVDTRILPEWRTILIVGDGEPIEADEDKLVHLGTVFAMADAFVWHVFEVIQ